MELLDDATLHELCLRIPLNDLSQLIRTNQRNKEIGSQCYEDRLCKLVKAFILFCYQSMYVSPVIITLRNNIRIICQLYFYKTGTDEISDNWSSLRKRFNIDRFSNHIEVMDGELEKIIASHLEKKGHFYTKKVGRKPYECGAKVGDVFTSLKDSHRREIQSIITASYIFSDGLDELVSVMMDLLRYQNILSIALDSGEEEDVHSDVLALLDKTD